MKILTLFLVILFGVPQGFASSQEIATEVDSLLIEVGEEERVGEPLKVEVRYLSPAWRVRRQGQGLRLLGMSPEVIRSLQKLDREHEYRCYAEADFKKSGIHLARLRNCRFIWKNS
jgi:hypothetical protein